MISEIVIMVAQTSAKMKPVVKERIIKQKCLCCDSSLLKRGLCFKCYYKWRKARAALGSEAKRATFDAKLIKAGKLLAPQAVRALKTEDLFQSAAKQV